MSYDIVPIETKKNKIPQRGVMKSGTIPTFPTIAYFCGRCGSGKSQLLLNLLSRGEFYGKKNGRGHYFNDIHVFSPTVRSDDIYETLELKEEQKHEDLKPSELGELIKKQKDQMEQKGADKCKRLLIIFDDVQGEPKFLRSKEFQECIFAYRHMNASIFICGQSYKSLPRKCRLQVKHMFYFRGSNNEMEVIAEEFCPSGMDKKDMLDLIHQATEEDYSFLYMNLYKPERERYRINLTKLIDIKNLENGGYDENGNDENLRKGLYDSKPSKKY